ncbi:hypothetical protein SAMN05443254_109336 [Bradyrhizobium sp. OK095]|nr:hypothetical protein SAMN05443254_109336 [Bradyrhizobium sp. OK095]
MQHLANDCDIRDVICSQWLSSPPVIQPQPPREIKSHHIPSGKTVRNRRQPLSTKIFHFTEIRICRMCRPSQPTKGAVVRRHERGLGLRWTRAALKAGLLCAGRDEPREHVTDRDRRTAPKPCEASWRSRVVRVRRNRVVLAVVATVKPLRRRHCVNRRGAVYFAEVTEASRNSSPGRARHRPSNHRAGKAWFRLPCVSPVHCVCNPFSMGVLWVPAGARSSLRPFFPRGCDEKHSSGKSCREDTSVCRSAGGVVAFQIEHFRER